MSSSSAMLLAGVAHAKDNKLKVAENPADVKPGRSALLKSSKGMHYFLRVPKKYSAKKGARLVVFLHGSSAAAAPLIAENQEKRAEQADVGRKLFREASGLFRASKRDEGKKVLRTLLAEAPYTYEGYYAWKWLQPE